MQSLFFMEFGEKHEIMREKRGGERLNKNTPKILQGFLIYMTTIKGKSKNTRQEYLYDLMLFFRFMKALREELDTASLHTIQVDDIEIDFIKDISLDDLYYFLSYCEEERNNGTSSRARKVASLRSFFKYLTQKKRALTYNPADELESPLIGKRNPIYLNAMEAGQLFDGVKEGRHYYRNYCILTLLLNLGLRVSELCDLNVNSIQNDVVRVVGKGNKERILPLNDSCLASISDYMTYERCMVKEHELKQALLLSQKGSRLNKRSVQRMVKKWNVDSGLDKEVLTPHKLRHTTATLIYKEKPDIRGLQYILGHASVSTTQVYTHVDSSLIKELLSSNPINTKRKQ